MRYKFSFKDLIVLLLLLHANNAGAEANTELLQAFNLRYQHYLSLDSQMVLPFNRMDKAEWKQLQASTQFRLVFNEPGRYYIGKSYTFKLYHDPAKNLYYLDAIGGFWGMEELVFGPISEQELK